MGGLSARQSKFIDEYMIDLNATQAAIRAGYSPKYADRQAHLLMKDDRISGAIKRAIAEQSKRTGIIADRILQELAKIAFADVSNIINLDEGEIRRGIHADVTAAIQTIRNRRVPSDGKTVVEKEIRLYDKTKALEMLARHLGLFNDSLQLEGAYTINFSGEADLQD